MKNVFNLARGTVRLKISGVEPEKLLNALCEKNIEFWDTASEGDFTLSLSAHASELADIRSCALKNGCEIKITDTRGGKKLTRSAKRRYALLAGLAICIVVAAFSSLFVWNISVAGNNSLSYGEVLRALGECGVEYGCYWPAISAEDVKNEILMKYPDVSWLSLNMNSSELEVIIHERVNKPDIINEAEYRSIYANKCGIITKISVLQGKSCVNVGDTVCEGDMLISGIIDSETGDERKVHAMGDVTARTWYEISAVTPLTENRKTEKSGSGFKFSLLTEKNPINFYSDSRNNESSCDKINKIRYISFGKSYVIPLGVMLQSGKFYEAEVCDINKDEAELRMRENLLSELRYRIGDGEIVSSNFTVSECGGLLIITLRAECLENIA